MSEYNIQMNKYNALSDNYDQLYPKPMKHASTHAKDGSDPILPSSIGAYSKEETDTLLANNDPRQWGLGKDGIPIVNKATLDGLFIPGWYMFYDQNNTLDNNIRFGLVEVKGRNRNINNFCVQEIWTNDFNQGGGLPYKAERKWEGSEWNPLEWFNPPMVLGVEYRTTERYQGKPVYAKRILCESMPSGAGYVDIQPSATEVPNALISTAIVIRCYGRASVAATIPFYSGANDFMQVGVVSDSAIRLYTAKAYGGTAEITAYYVKTTD